MSSPACQAAWMRIVAGEKRWHGDVWQLSRKAVSAGSWLEMRFWHSAEKHAVGNMLTSDDGMFRVLLEQQPAFEHETGWKKNVISSQAEQWLSPLSGPLMIMPLT
jgi:hypothetical protein